MAYKNKNKKIKQSQLKLHYHVEQYGSLSVDYMGVSV